MAVFNITKANYKTEVSESEKPVLLDFWAPWCGPCRMIAPFVEQLSDEMPEIKAGKVNIDEEPELAAEFGVMSIPTLIVMKGGKAVKRTLGAMPKQLLKEFIEEAIK